MSYWILLPLGAFAGALIYMIWAGFKAKREYLEQKRRGGGHSHGHPLHRRPHRRHGPTPEESHQLRSDDR